MGQDRLQRFYQLHRSCGPWQAAMRSFWPDRSRASSTDSIPITAARSCGKASRGQRCRASKAGWLGARRPIIAVCLSPCPALWLQPGNVSGSLWALDPKTGIARWHTPVAHTRRVPGAKVRARTRQSQAVTVMPGGVFSGSMDGHLRAYSTIDGKILWDFDTAKAFQTQNGVRASGGPSGSWRRDHRQRRRLHHLRQYAAGVFSRRQIGL